jgi:TM2 domain-containing membrane protein YozV
MSTVGPSKGIAMLLSFLFGPFGADKFYVGAPSLGILQLLLTLSILGMFISVPWAFLSTIVLGLAILTSSVPALYPNVNWAPVTSSDMIIVISIIAICAIGYFVRLAKLKNENYEKDKNKK